MSTNTVDDLSGAWRLVSCVMENVATGEHIPIWGENPNGYLVLTVQGRWIVVQTAQDRKPPHTEPDQAAAFRSMLAYSGRYQVNGNKITVKVDIAWDESWIGTEQVRHFRIDDGRLHIEAPPQQYANFGDAVMRALLVWERDANG